LRAHDPAYEVPREHRGTRRSNSTSETRRASSVIPRGALTGRPSSGLTDLISLVWTTELKCASF
jgi:hypothetical protein